MDRTTPANSPVYFAEILSPIPGSSPAGIDAWTSALCDEIREARRSDDDLPQGEWRCETKSADWQRVNRLSVEFLATTSKDLRVLALLVESEIKQRGFDGLRDGLVLTNDFTLAFWESLFPEIDEEDGVAWRANVFNLFDKTLGSALTAVPLTNSATGGANYTFSDWEGSKGFVIPDSLDGLDYEELQQVEETRARAAADGRITSEHWKISVAATRRAHFESVFTRLTESRLALDALEATLDEKLGRESPGLGALRKALSALHDLIERTVADKRRTEPDETPVGPPTESTATEGGVPDPTGSGPTFAAGAPFASTALTRQQAFAVLTDIARYFRTNEPHNPISFLLDRAVRWGNLPLDAWLAEVVKSDDVLGNLNELIGIQPRAER